MMEEQNECFQVFIKFLNTCKSSSKSIELWDKAKERSINDYGIDDTSKAIQFISEKISIIGICSKEQLGYGKNPNSPYVYEYIFKYNDEDGNLGCLAFFKNPKLKAKIKWFIKSLHKDDLNRVADKSKEVFWLSSDEQKILQDHNNNNKNRRMII